MANQFIIRKGYKSLAASEITGSLITTGNIISGGDVKSQRLYIQNKKALDSASNFLYIDPNTQFSSGIYINNQVRIDGGLLGSYNEDLQLRTTTTTRITISNTDGSVRFHNYGAGYLKTDSSGNITVDTSTIEDTLDSVTDRGATTTNSITIGDLVAEGGTFTDPVTIFDSSASENPRLSLGRNAGESLQFDVTDTVGIIRHKNDGDSNSQHTLQFIIDSPSTGDKVFTFQEAGNTSATYLTLNSTTATFGTHAKIASGKYLEFSGQGKLINMDVTAWSNADEHNILYAGWLSNLGDYLSFKVPGNSTSGHGNLIIGDNGLWFGRMNTTDSAAATDSATNPHSGNGSNYFRVDTSGNATLAGGLTVGGLIDLGSGAHSIKKTANTSGNHPAIELYASGTGDSGAAIAIQQQTAEGDTIIFADYEPHVEWGISAENGANEIHFTAGSSTNSLGSKTFKNNAGSNRTAYKKMTINLSSGNVAIGGETTFGGNLLLTGGGTIEAPSVGGGESLTLKAAGGLDFIIDSNGNGADDQFFKVMKHTNTELFSVKETGLATFAGDVTVAGTLTAQEFHTEFVSASIIYESGSTKFGDTADDVHNFTGSIIVNNAADNSTRLFRAERASTYFFDLGAYSQLTHQVNGSVVAQTIRNTTTSQTTPLLSLGHSNNGAHITTYGTNENLIIDPNGTGNVGIGATNPTSKLHVDSSTAFSLTSATGDTLFLSDDTNGSAIGSVGASIGFSGPQEVQRQAAIAALRTGTDHDHIGLTFYTHPGTSNDETIVEKLRITHDGKVGIGTTAPDYTLDINGNLGINDYIYHNGDSNTRIGFSGNDSFIVRTSGTDRITVNSSGDAQFNKSVKGTLDNSSTGLSTLAGFIVEQGAENGTRNFVLPGAVENAFAGASSRFTVTSTKNGSSINLGSNMFKSTNSFSSTSVATNDTIVITITGRNFNHSSGVGIAFSSTAWRAKNIEIETSTDGTNYTSRGSVTNHAASAFFVTFNTGGTATTHIKYTLTNFNSTSLRISHVFANNYTGGDPYFIDKYYEDTKFNQLKIDSSGATDNYYLQFLENGTQRFSFYENSNNVYFNGGGGSTHFRPRFHGGSGNFLVSGANVGIGTNTPNHKLDIYSDTNVPLRIHRPNSALDTTEPVGIGFSHRGDTANSTTDTRAGIFSSYNGDLFLSVDAAGRVDDDPIADSALFIEGSNGNVGIGTTSPSHLLSIGTAGNSSGRKISLYLGGTDENFAGIGAQRGESNLFCSSEIRFINENNSSGTGAFAIATGGNSLTERMRITSVGNVGIGTTNPVDNYASGITPEPTNLAVHGGTGTGYKEVAHFAAGTDANDTGATVRIGQVGNDRGMFIKAGRGTSDQAKALLGLRNSSNTDETLITLEQGGNVGIGISDPTYKLDVNGEVRFRNGNIRSNNSFDFVTPGGAAQQARFKSIQVSTSYSGTLPNNGILFHTDTNLYRSAANLLKTDDSLEVDGRLYADAAFTVTQAASDQNTAQDSGTIPSTSISELIKFQGNYTNGQYTTELVKVDRSGNLPLYFRQSKGTANAFTNLIRIGDHGQTNGTDIFAVFGNARVDGTLTAGNVTATSVVFTDEIRDRSGQDLTITAGEASGYLTQATHNDEVIRLAAEGGVIVYSSTDNLTSGLDKATTLIDSSGHMSIASDLTVGGGDITLNGTGRIQGVDTVSAGTDAANKTYVDNAVAGVGLGTFLPLAGGTMSGVITSDGITSGTTAANRTFQVSTAVSGALHVKAADGGTSGAAHTAPLVTVNGNGTTVQGGIYVSQNSSTGTSLGFFTTDSYATGPQLGLAILDNGTVTINRGNLALEGTGRIQGIDTVSAGTDAANKNYVDNKTYDNRYYTETEIDSQNTTLNETLAHLRGWVPGYSNADDASVRWDRTEDALELQSDSDSTTGVVYQARRIENGETVRFTIMVKGSAASTNGLYLRLYQHDGNLPDGKTHVSNDAGGTYVQEDDRGDTSWYENGAITTGWVTFEREYTAPADGYISLVVLNWVGIGNNSVYLKTPDIQTTQSPNSNKLDGLDSSQFLRSDTSDTMNGVLTINSGTDAQLNLTSPDTWAGIGFDDANSSTSYIWYNGQHQTFAIGGGGSNVSGKKLHVHGGMTIGANKPGTSAPTNGLLVEGRITGGEHILATDNVYAAGAQGFVFGSSVSEGEYIYRSGNDIRIYAGGADRLTVDGDAGNVGIGTTTPSANLQVVGSGSTVLDVQGSQGQLFSITDDLTGDLFTVSDISGIPILNVNASGDTDFDSNLNVTGSVNIGDGTADTRLVIKRVDGNAADDIQFFNGTTRVGEIGTKDTTWLRINQETNKNIYTPRYIRADGGLFVDDTNHGIDGSGVLKNASLTGTYTNTLTFNTVTINTPIVGSAAKIRFANNDFIRFDDTANRFHFDVDGGTNNASVQAATFVGDLSGTATNANAVPYSGLTGTVPTWNQNTTGTAAKIQAGGSGPSAENLNTIANGVSTGQLEFRGFNASSTNAPSVSDNANGVITVGQHSSNYSAQIAFSSNGNMYWRDNPNGVHGSWRTMWDSGNDGASSGLDADKLDGQHGSHYLDYGNFTNTPDLFDGQYSSLSGIPSSFTPAQHTQAISTITGLQSALDSKASLDHIRSLGTQAFTGTATTAGFISEMEGDGAFDSFSSVFKTSWSYAGNFNLSDAGRFTETAGASFLTWTDNSSDSTRGNITVLAIAPNTGGSAGKMFVYNDQGSSYAPGWREIWTSTSDGAGSGLDADKLDGNEATAFATAAQGTKADNALPKTGGTMSGNINMGNFNLNAVNHIEINDPGNTEGISWKNGNGWKIVECPDNLSSNTSGNLQFATSNTRRFTIDTSGNVNASGDVIAFSDKRVKEDVKTIDSALDKVTKLRGVSYNRTDIDDKAKKIGVIAQEVKEILPEVVQYSESSDRYSVAYGNMAGLFIEAIKEQQKQIEDLKAIVDKLQNEK